MHQKQDLRHFNTVLFSKTSIKMHLFMYAYIYLPIYLFMKNVGTLFKMNVHLKY